MFKLAESMKAKIQLQAKVILQELETGEYAWAVRDVAAGLERIQRRWAR